ncbi:MAG: hypothetical protein KBS55_06455 [Bacteroidales bacterium]|nr:hypothetical protein [Candidatus Cryptobacteroides aphodequi]
MKKVTILIIEALLLAFPLFCFADGDETIEVHLSRPFPSGPIHHAPEMAPVSAYVQESTGTLYLYSETIIDYVNVEICDLVTNDSLEVPVYVSSVPVGLPLPDSDAVEIIVTLQNGRSYCGYYYK